MKMEYEYYPNLFDQESKDNTMDNIVRIRAVKKDSFNFWYKIGEKNKKRYIW